MECMADPAGIERVTGAIGEHQGLACGSWKAEMRPLDALQLPMRGKDGRERPGHRHDTARVSALWGAEGGHPAHARKRLSDPQGSSAQVDVVPGQAQDLAEAKASLESDGHRCPDLAAGDGLENPVGLLGSHRCLGPLLDARRYGQGCCIAIDEAATYGIVERGTEDSPEMAHGTGREAGLELGIDPRIDVPGRELREAEPTEVGRD